MKKTFKFLFIIVFIAAMLLSVSMFSFAASGNVVDESHLFTADEIAKLEEAIASIKSQYGYDVLIVTSEFRGGSTKSQARTYFQEHFPLNQNGTVFFIYKGRDKSVREYSFETFGNYKSEYGWDYINKAIERRVLPELKSDNFYGAANVYLGCVENLCKDRYYFDGEKADGSNYGDQGSKIDWPIVIIGGAIVGLIFAGIYVAILTKKMKPVQVATTAREYVVPGSFNKTRERDQYLYSTTTRVRIKNSSSSGGGSSRSTSFRSSGGGGRF